MADLPRFVYVVMGVNYDESDGYYWPESEYLHSCAFVDKADAEKECQKQIDFFCRTEDISKFANPDIYGGGAGEKWTWEELRAQEAWTEPFLVHTLRLRHKRKKPCHKKK